MSDIVTGISAVAEADERLAHEREQERRVIGKIAKRGEQWRAERAKWEREAVAAELDGKDSDPPPGPPDEAVLQIVLGRVRANVSAAIMDRHRTIVAAASEIRAEVEAAVANILAAAEPHAAALADLLADLEDATRALDELGDSRTVLDPNRRAERHPMSVTMSALLHAIEHGPDDLLAGRAELPRQLGLIVAKSAISDAAPEPQIVTRDPSAIGTLPDGRVVRQVGTVPGARP